MNADIAMEDSCALNLGAIARARERYAAFLESTAAESGRFRLTVRAEPTPYARCFAVFGFQLLQDHDRLARHAEKWSRAIRADLDKARIARAAAGANLAADKPYLQLLTFSLSALAALYRLDIDPLPDHVLPVLSTDVEADLQRAGALDGKAGSGNQAMFLAILLLHAQSRLGVDTADRVALWQALFLRKMNRFGFWGGGNSISHLQFQNGYHIYEIFEYLDAEVSRWSEAADYVASLADADGHFAPYPGGGGCYDYDAVFMITGAGDAAVRRHRALLLRTAASILREQNPDGGFCESACVRPRSVRMVGQMWRHATSARGRARIERSRYGLTLLRPKHDRIQTHWSTYSREWGESDLWDSWFRMLTLARIDIALDPAHAADWGFIDYPGIGYHSSLRATSSTI